MKKTKIKASLMLEDTFKSPLMIHDVEITSKDYKKGFDHVYAKCQLEVLKRLTVIIDKENLKMFFG